MINKKGVIFLVLVVLFSISSLAQIHEIPTGKYLGMGSHDSCSDTQSLFYIVDDDRIRERGSECRYELAAADKRARDESGIEEGCVIAMYDHDGPGHDDCGIAYANPGDVVDDNPSTLSIAGSRHFYWASQNGLLGGDDASWQSNRDAEQCFKERVRTGFNNKAYLCQTNSQWYRCTDASLHSVQVVDGTPYVCIADINNILTWQPADGLDTSNDEDGDGVPSVFDCRPNDANVHGAYPLGCAADDDPSDCTVLPAVEICDDGIDNNCDGEIDNCNTNKFSCESDGKSWINNGPNGNNCCGDSFDDLGVIAPSGLVEGDLQSSSFVCLNRNKQYVGHSQDTDPDGWEDARCQGEWCWVSATAATSLFEVFTIKRPNQNPFDVVSNTNEWFACDATTINNFNIDQFANLADADRISQARRFACYNEGSRTSFAQCMPDIPLSTDTETGAEISLNIKQRKVGDGLFRLPLPANRINADGSPIPSDSYFIEITDNSDYSQYYDLSSTVDFTGYDHIEFMLQFTNIANPPALVELTFYAADDSILFQEHVLASATNSPILEPGRWMHIKHPIPELQNVARMRLLSLDTRNTFILENVYVSGSTTSAICSGTAAPVNPANSGQSSWLQDLDTVDHPLSAENICNLFYSTLDEDGNTVNAWLGGEDFPSNSAANRCCGNQVNEYYAGDASSNNGCWNSYPVTDGTRIMNVEFEVEYDDVSYTVDTSPLQFGYTVQSITQQATLEQDAITKQLDSYAISCNLDDDCEQRFASTQPVACFASVCQYPFEDFVAQTNDPVHLYFTDSATGSNLGSSLNLAQIISQNVDSISLQAEFSIAYAPSAVAQPVIPRPKNSIQYTCNSNICIYPLPGAPGQEGYKITNPYPNLYDLFFLAEDGTKTLITEQDQVFVQKGNVVAQRVPLQVLYSSEEDENLNTINQFFSCNPVSYIANNQRAASYITHDPYCEVREGYHCAYSVNNNGDVSLSQWDNTQLAEVGYSDETQDTVNQADVELLLKPYEADLPYNQSTFVLPARNIMPNALFEIRRGTLDGWRIFDDTNALISGTNREGNVVRPLLTENTLSLPAGWRLHSQKIAVPQNTEFYCGATELTCGCDVRLINNDGAQINQISSQGENQFNTATASYIEVSFRGSCDITEPVLQRIDEDGLQPVTFSSDAYIHDLYGSDAFPRTAAACCPTSYCWNGYTCVEPMGDKTTLSEPTEDDRHYRCVDGTWTRQTLKQDWNLQQVGFCKQQTQCFIAPPGFNGGDVSTDYSVEDFLDSNAGYPSCINDGEYVLDHLCEQGNWTSRTKFLAAQLLDFAQQQDDYVLYCTGTQGLPEVEDSNKIFVLGSPQQVAVGPGVTEESTTCFDKQDTVWSSLVSAQENKCVNNFCILRYRNGRRINTAIATSLNKPLDDPNSFTNALGANPIDPATCTGTGDFKQCSSEISYNEDVNAVIYSRQGISLQPSTLSTLWTNLKQLLSNFLGRTSSVTLSPKVITEVQNADHLYFLKQDDKQVQAAMEIIGAPNQEVTRQVLVAEYTNFETDLCTYISTQSIEHPQLRASLAQQAGLLGVDCFEDPTNPDVQRIEAVAALDFLWPQLTGKLRVE